jgi:hypothetical protein
LRISLYDKRRQAMRGAGFCWAETTPIGHARNAIIIGYSQTIRIQRHDVDSGEGFSICRQAVVPAAGGDQPSRRRNTETRRTRQVMIAEIIGNLGVNRAPLSMDYRVCALTGLIAVKINGAIESSEKTLPDG